MKEYIKKHWLYFIGASFIIMSLMYFFKFAIESNALNSTMKVGIGFGFGTLGCLSSFIFHKSMSNTLKKFIAGVSLIVIYYTSFIAGVYYEIWNLWVFFGVITSITMGTLFLSSRLNFRFPPNISLIGFFLAPLFFTVENKKMPFLAIYLVTISFFYFIVSIRKSWPELRVISFIGTWFVYYSYITNNMSTIEKNSYLLAAMIIYIFLAALTMYTMSSKDKIQTFDYILSLYNGFLLARYLPQVSEYWYVKCGILIGCGIIYIISAILLNYLFKNSKKHFLLKFIIGAFFILSAATSANFREEFLSLYVSYIWITAIILMLTFMKLFKIKELRAPILILWFAASTYWFFSSWNTPIANFFGFYIPILNWSGIASILLASIGFIMLSNTSLGIFNEESSYTNNRDNSINVKPASCRQDTLTVPIMISIISHLILCGFLSLEASNIFKEYQILRLEHTIVTALIWPVYSIILLVRAIYNNLKLYRNFAIIILILSSFKIFFMDLSSSKTIYKMIFLFVLGIIILIGAGLNKKWNEIQTKTRQQRI